MFPRDEILNLDCREIELWLNEALRIKLSKTLDIAYAVRIGFAEEKDYDRITKKILKLIDKKNYNKEYNKKVQDNWETLRLMKRG